MEKIRLSRLKPAFFIGLLALLFSCFITAGAVHAATPLQLHGALSVKGRNLVDKNKKKFQLKGISTHGIAWFPEYVNKKTFKTLRDQWGANAIRLAMYTMEYGGYCSGGDTAGLEATIDKGIRACSSLGMYCIIDWHILSDGNPDTFRSQATDFFSRMSAKYAGKKNVLYEICNEPNSGTTWEQIRAYADAVIPVIRKNAPGAIIIVGTPTWSQDVDIAAQNPIQGQKNIMYSLHFYAATHKDDIRARLKTAMASGLPVMITEFSICDASGNGTIDRASAAAWKKLIRKYNLSYFAWNLSNKNEASALLKPGTTRLYGWKKKDLSETGKWVKALMAD